MADFYKLQAEVRELTGEVPPQSTIYLVAAWNDGWSIRRQTWHEEYTTRQDAEKAAKCLASCWRHRTIIEIKLPGEK